MKLQVIECNRDDNYYYGEARISESDYQDAGASEICAAIAQQCDEANDVSSVSLRGYDEQREVVFFAIH